MHEKIRHPETTKSLTCKCKKSLVKFNFFHVKVTIHCRLISCIICLSENQSLKLDYSQVPACQPQSFPPFLSYFNISWSILALIKHFSWDHSLIVGLQLSICQSKESNIQPLFYTYSHKQCFNDNCFPNWYCQKMNEYSTIYIK